ncbi:MAG: ATP-grasp domain-containing protein [Lentihominibacter sp.]|jgi:biotin carboxylase
MKKIMILGAGVYQVPLIEQAKKMGLYTIAVSPEGRYPGLVIADKVFNIDVRDEDTILEIARAEKILGVITDQTDLAVRTVAYVAEKMNLPGIGYETARLFTDKCLMRKKTGELGLPTIDYRVVTALDEAIEFFKKCNGRAIIKPVDNQGSRGVYLIDSIRELEARFFKAMSYSPTRKVIIEQHIRGREFEVDSIVVNYKEKTLMYGDTDLYDIPNVFASKTRLYPSDADEKTINKLLKLNHDIVTGFGLKQGFTNNEYIQDENTGEIYLIEAAARGGGSFISSHIGRLQSGINTSEFLLKLAMGEIKELPEFETAQCHCGYVSFYLPEGEVINMDSVEQVKTLPFISKHSLDDIYPGLKTGPFSDKTARNVIILSAETRDELNGRVKEIREKLDIKVRTRRGTEGPIWE